MITVPRLHSLHSLHLVRALFTPVDGTVLRLGGRVTVRVSAAEIKALRAKIIANSVVDANGCWIWQKSTRNGYGQMNVRNSIPYTHRLAYQLFVGEIPKGRQVMHFCDVRRCNNPEHLSPATAFANIHDMWRKGRARLGPPKFGLDNPKAWLTDAQCEAIRRRWARGESQRAIAGRFGCSSSTVRRIALGETRAHPRKAS